MFKLYITLNLIALCCMHHVQSAIPQRRFLARQELATTTTTAAAPYPAAGITPEVPFDLPTETTAAPKPDQTYGPPDQTYGPPDQTYGPPDQTYGPPDQTYGPPADTAPETEGTGNGLSQNIIQPRLNNFRQPKPIKFRALPPQPQIVEVIRSEPTLIYTLV